MSREQIDAAFDVLNVANDRAAAGRPLTGEDLAGRFRDRGWPDETTDAALQAYGAVAQRFERKLGPGLPPAPTREQDAQRRVEIERMMKASPGSYWKEPALQEELYEIYERATPAAEPTGEVRAPAMPAPAAATGTGRRGEIEALMRDDPRAYWRNPEIQAGIAKCSAAIRRCQATPAPHPCRSTGGNLMGRIHETAAPAR